MFIFFQTVSDRWGWQQSSGLMPVFEEDEEAAEEDEEEPEQEDRNQREQVRSVLISESRTVAKSKKSMKNPS